MSDYLNANAVMPAGVKCRECCNNCRTVPVVHMPMRIPEVGNKELIKIQWHEVEPCDCSKESKEKTDTTETKATTTKTKFTADASPAKKSENADNDISAMFENLQTVLQNFLKGLAEYLNIKTDA